MEGQCGNEHQSHKLKQQHHASDVEGAGKETIILPLKEEENTLREEQAGQDGLDQNKSIALQIDAKEQIYVTLHVP